MKQFIPLALLVMAACSPKAVPLPDTSVPYTSVVGEAPVVAPEKVIETRTEYVTVTVTQELVEPSRCPRWPTGRPRTEAALSSFLFDAFQAYRCERLTREEIRKEQLRLVAP